MARLVGVTDGAGAALESYTLDEEGNRVTSHLSSANVTDANDRLIETETHVFSYDDNGYLRERTDKATGRVWRFTGACPRVGGESLRQHRHRQAACGRRHHVDLALHLLSHRRPEPPHLRQGLHVRPLRAVLSAALLL